MNGGITFKCIFCERAVATLDFDHTLGNRRTQAAAAINRHASEAHFSQIRTRTQLKSGSYGAL
jgi:hypothetical protein